MRKFCATLLILALMAGSGNMFGSEKTAATVDKAKTTTTATVATDTIKVDSSTARAPAGLGGPQLDVKSELTAKDLKLITDAIGNALDKKLPGITAISGGADGKFTMTTEGRQLITESLTADQMKQLSATLAKSDAPAIKQFLQKISAPTKTGMFDGPQKKTVVDIADRNAAAPANPAIPRRQ